MGNCSCVYSDYECSVVWSAKIVKARKQYRCTECGGVIQRGDKYERIGSLYDGSWSTYRVCSVCQEIAEVFFCDGYGATHLIEDLREHIEDLRGEISSECLADLTPATRGFVCDMIEKCWEELNELESA